jgi:serine/threonine protein kinase
LKVLKAHRLHDAQVVALFHQEIETVGKLDHPHLVRTLDAGRADGRDFLVMELLHGADLNWLIGMPRPILWPDICEVGRQAAAGLQYLHEQGLVHRDIKPSHLFVTTEGRVKVLSLGLARLSREQTGSEGLGGSGVILGTPAYMAPEQAIDSEAVDIRADLYSLGCTLFHLLTGRPPFSDRAYAVSEMMLAHREAPVPPIRLLRPDVPEELAAVLIRLLAKDRDDRPTTPAEVAVALRPFTAWADLSKLCTAATE